RRRDQHDLVGLCQGALGDLVEEAGAAVVEHDVVTAGEHLVDGEEPGAADTTHLNGVLRSGEDRHPGFGRGEIVGQVAADPGSVANEVADGGRHPGVDQVGQRPEVRVGV